MCGKITGKAYTEIAFKSTGGKKYGRNYRYS